MIVPSFNHSVVTSNEANTTEELLLFIINMKRERDEGKRRKGAAAVVLLFVTPVVMINDMTLCQNENRCNILGNHVSFANTLLLQQHIAQQLNDT